MALYLAISLARYSDLLAQNQEILIPHLYLSPPHVVTPVGISSRSLMLINLE